MTVTIWMYGDHRGQTPDNAIHPGNKNLPNTPQTGYIALITCAPLPVKSNSGDSIIRCDKRNRQWLSPTCHAEGSEASKQTRYPDPWARRFPFAAFRA